MHLFCLFLPISIFFMNLIVIIDEMKSSYRLYGTIGIVVMSILLSWGSIFTVKKNLGEIYPFFFWKLYTQPIGWENKVEDYRIYASDGQNCFNKRLPVRPTHTFSTGEYMYTFETIMLKYLKNKDQKSLDRIKDFVHHVEPGYKNYRIVKETYIPLDLKENKSIYDTATVISF